MEIPIISIVIPTFNREVLITECLNSMLNQNSDNWECLVVDDGSIDSTAEVVKKYSEKDSRIKFFSRNRDPKGASVCRNIGANYAIGDFVIFLDSDDVISSDFINVRTEWLNTHKNFDFHVFPSCFFTSKIGDQERLWNIVNKDVPDLKRFLDNDTPWHTTGTVWNRNSFLKIGGFFESAQSMQDWEVHVNALIRELKYSKSPDNISFLQHFIRQHEDNQISTSKLTIESAKNKLNTKVYIANIFINESLNVSKYKNDFICDFYRLAIDFKEAGFWNISKKTINSLRVIGLISLPLYFIIVLSLYFEKPIKHNSKISFSNNWIKVIIYSVLFKVYNIENIRWPKNRTKGKVYFN